MVNSMTLPVINDVFRCTILWQGSGGILTLNPRNVIHVSAPSLNEGDVADNLGNAMQTARAANEPLLVGSSSWIANAVDVLKLDGSSATQTLAMPHPWVMNSGGDYSPASAAVISLHTGQRGARGRGRFFCGPVAEGKMVNGRLLTADMTDMATGWGILISQLASLGSPLVVASYKHADAHVVTSHRIDQILGTQRRRQDQLR
jgi:hypothetical protein